jgi:hypothetical protein
MSRFIEWWCVTIGITDPIGVAFTEGLVAAGALLAAGVVALIVGLAVLAWIVGAIR